MDTDAETARSSAQAALGSLRILLADDHDVVREGLRTLLESQRGWSVCGEAATGREAVELALQFRPDVVVLDFGMPEMNGLDATSRIRKALPETEVLIITMHDSEELAREVRRAGARGFLLKTDARRHLVPAVQALAGHRSFFADTEAKPRTSALGELSVRAAVPAATDRLTPREREVLQLVAAGKSSKDVAKALDIRTKTVEAHRANMMNKLDLHSVGELVRYAVRYQIVAP